jgi:hypothetical protein
LVDPWSFLTALTAHLAPRGVVIASIPNGRHAYTLHTLGIKGYWPYARRGLDDWGHLRFFTKRNIIELFREAGLSINLLAPNYRVIQRPHRLNSFARFLAIPGLKPFLTFQYLVRAHLIT